MAGEVLYIEVEVKDFEPLIVWEKKKKEKLLSVFSPPILPGVWSTPGA